MGKNMEVKDRKVLVVGIGKSGMAVSKVLSNLGGKVTLFDGKSRDKINKQSIETLEALNVELIFEEMNKAVNEFDLIVLSPGVPKNLDFILEAEKKSIEVIGELELAYRLAKGKFVAITGTNGKTTTTTLVYEMFKKEGRKATLVGNIGSPVIEEAVKDDEDTWHITEVSSFQLETVKYFKPVAATMLNITPDHLDRHKSMENYGFTKRKIVEMQDMKDYFVVNFEDKFVMDMARGTRGTMVPFSKIDVLKFGVFTRDNNIIVKNGDGETINICPIQDIKLLGTHNLENALAGTALAYFTGISPKTIAETLTTFQGVEHRLEQVEKIDGISFINDSKGTNVDASIKAIQAVDTPIILIAGGYDKNAEFGKFVDAFENKVKSVVLMGATATKMKVAIEEKGYSTVILKDMKSCVEEAFRIAEDGDTVLLSPACASWDMYSSFEERGKDFKNWVQKLKI